MDPAPDGTSRGDPPSPVDPVAETVNEDRDSLGSTRTVGGPPAGGTEPPPTGRPGAQIGPYQVERELGRGGMGVVYLARHVDTGQRVALKMLLGGSEASYSERGRFAREAESAAGLDHPGIVKVFDHGTAGGSLFMAMEYVEGPALADVLHKLKLEDLVYLLAQVARALGHAHERGIVHRDIKPANILVRDSDGQAIITDFGLARPLDKTSLTKTGVVMGTPHYLAPEQADDSKSVSPAADVYSLGTILYEGLTGSTPFGHIRAVLSLLRAIMTEAPAPPSESNHRVPKLLDGICMQALEKKPADRYPNGTALAEVLEHAHESLWGHTEPFVLEVPDAGDPGPRPASVGPAPSRPPSKILGAVRSGFFGTVGVSLLSVSLCCGASGALCLSGDNAKGGKLAERIAGARIVTPEEAATASGLVAIERSTASVDSAIVAAGKPCLYVETWTFDLERTIARAPDGSETVTVRPSGISRDRAHKAVASFHLGPLRVDTENACYENLRSEKTRSRTEEHGFSMLRADKPITAVGYVEDGVMTSGESSLVLAHDMSYAELLADLRSEGLGGFVGRLGLIVGVIFLAAALLSFALRRSRAASPPS